MDFSLIDARLLSHPGARREYHEKWGWMVYWVGSRQFACELVASPSAKAPYAGRHLLSLKCDPDRILELRAEWPDAVLPGYYSDGRTWVSLDLDGGLPTELVLELCDRSYELVFARLTRRVQREIAVGQRDGGVCPTCVPCPTETAGTIDAQSNLPEGDGMTTDL